MLTVCERAKYQNSVNCASILFRYVNIPYSSNQCRET